MRPGGGGGGGCSGGSGAEDVGPQAASTRERARGCAATTRCSAQVMAGRAPGTEGRRGEETRGRGGRAGMQRPSRCASAGKGSGAGSAVAWPQAVWRAGLGGRTRRPAAREERRWVDSGGPGPWRGSERRGGRAGSLGVWLQEQFKVTLHIRALRPPLLDPGEGEASALRPPRRRAVFPVIGSASPAGTAAARLAPDWLAVGGRDLTAQGAADWCQVW